MLESAISLTFGLLTVAWVLNLYRLVIGPSLPDRVLALDTMYINSIALIVVYGIQVDSKLYFEAAMLIADGTWDAKTMKNVEELDPKPFFTILDRIGLPTRVLKGGLGGQDMAWTDL